MKYILRLSLLLLATHIPLSAARENIVYRIHLQSIPVQKCYAPGTPEEYTQEIARKSIEQLVGNSLTEHIAQTNENIELIISDDYRWWATATDGAGLQQGDPTTLTWSIVPDGTSIHGYNGEATSDSILQAELDKIYPGGKTEWLPLFEQVFQRWGELTGINYVYEPNDDGASFPSGWPSAPGALGVRGDIRISGHPIDGNYGILAYNFYPDSGDMIIDVPDAFYNNTGNNSLGFRNMLAHEHGHGIGLAHTCPVNQTKLMEPYISLAFDGPQHDDVLDANRGYGDAREHNDSPVAATDLGAVPQVLLQGQSIDDDGDPDLFAFELGDSSALSASVTPIGYSYDKGPQTGNCSTGDPFNSLILQDLKLELLDTDGTTVLSTADNTAAGLAEEISNVTVDFGAGTYYLRATGDTSGVAQLYSLDVTVVSNDGCGGSVVDLSGLEVNAPDTFECSATSRLILEDATVYDGGTLIISAPAIEMRNDVIIQQNARLQVNPSQ